MQRIPDADDLASSSDTGRSDSDSERQLLSFCEGCYVLKGTGEQCNLHGYGGAPLQSNNNFLTSFSYNEQWNKYCNYQGHMQNRRHFKGLSVGTDSSRKNSHVESRLTKCSTDCAKDTDFGVSRLLNRLFSQPLNTLHDNSHD